MSSKRGGKETIFKDSDNARLVLVRKVVEAVVEGSSSSLIPVDGGETPNDIDPDGQEFVMHDDRDRISLFLFCFVCLLCA